MIDRKGLLHVGLVVALCTAAAPVLRAQGSSMPAPQADGDQPAPAPAPEGTPEAPPMPPPENAPAPEQPAAEQPAADPAPQAEPAPAATPAPAPAPAVPLVPSVPSAETGKLSIPLLTPSDVRGSLTQRLFMDAVSGAAGGAAILALGWMVAAPLALLPWLLPQQASDQSLLGVPVSMLVTAAAVGTVLVAGVAASAALQRLVRPLLGPQPSWLGPVLGALFFGGVGGAIGMVASYLLITTPPEPMREFRDRLVGDVSTSNGRALALTGAITVALAVPLAALGAGIGGPVSAEVEDARSADAAATSGGAPSIMGN
ncbi:MAG: hypothetical protein HY904_00620 [Deltaproteobacteria bacterium]|nr:hypothetical protein [Deltaproteobacteria bacterium]